VRSESDLCSVVIRVCIGSLKTVPELSPGQVPKAAGLVVVAATSAAHADPTYLGCTITNVEWDNYDVAGGAEVGFICAGSAGWAYARNTLTAGCNYANSVDTLKSWFGLLQAALLSGHHINFQYTLFGNHCSGTGGAYEVTRVELVP